MNINNQKNNLYPRGSKWRKWDLHFHTPSSYDYKCKSISNHEIINILLEEKIEAVTITDHHFIDAERITDLKNIAKDKILILPGIEFCSESRGSEPIHFIGIFPENCDIKYVWNEINSKTDIAKKKEDGKKDSEIYCNLEKTSKLIKDLGGIVSIHAGSKSNSIEEITNSLPVKMAEKEDIAKYIDIFELGQEKDQQDYINKVFPKIGSHPMVICSDNCNIKEYKLKQTCWIKANLSFEGLKQILYEPEPGERVWIGPTIPDQKNDYQIINKIKFSGTKDFPEEIEFNQNLCSVIGSRSSGKSALLAYIAHAVDKELAETLVKGPGEGKEYNWEKINIDHSIEWDNGLINDKSPGMVIYIPQNYLFSKSKDSEEIKKKIEPILFKKLPVFEIKYNESKNNLDRCNKKITELVKEWFRLSGSISGLDERIKNLGDKTIIESEKSKTEQKIDAYKQKYSLSEQELNEYKDIKTKIAELESKIQQNHENLRKFNSIFGNNGVFRTLEWELDPSIEELQRELIDKISIELEKSRESILYKINKIINDYKYSVTKNIKTFKQELQKINKDNKNLISKYQKNEELEKLVKKVSEYDEVLKNLDNCKKEKKESETNQESKAEEIKKITQGRKKVLDDLKKLLDSLNQNNIENIKFAIEYGIRPNDLEKVARKINLKEVTDFVKNYEIKIETVRENPEKLLKDIYSGEDQKINTGYDKQEVANELLILTETILFIGEMESDHIGGFSETTMTPGRRALFLLRLILAESDDRWPILIDQPEDNLDSRSITDEIVPFLKKKKKERQIIMVSHNANLVIGADSEQIIVANRHGSDRPNEDEKQFNYLTGSIEYTKEKDKKCEDTLKAQGIREHACDILDGGKEAFEHRGNKYNLTKA